MDTTVREIEKMLQAADEQELAVLERALAADTRKGVRKALDVARRRVEAQKVELKRLIGLYDYQNSLAQGQGGGVIVGLDEVGRGPIAGPLAVGAVVLPDEPLIEGLDDSKKVAPEKREEIASQIKQVARAWTVQFVEASEIDAIGISAALRKAFSNAIKAIEDAGMPIGVVLIDGNPLHVDPREINVVKGDGKCASIAAASIVAKVTRDSLMVQLDRDYPGYGLAGNKGYGSASHMEAIRTLGLSPIHRKTFCTSAFQETLF